MNRGSDAAPPIDSRGHTAPPSGTPDLLAFIRARLNEDEEVARDAYYSGQSGRALAEVQAKRSILDLHVPYRRIIGLGCETCLGAVPGRPFPDFPCPTLRLVALPYADHPDYQQEWRP